MTQLAWSMYCSGITVAEASSSWGSLTSVTVLQVYSVSQSHANRSLPVLAKPHKATDFEKLVFPPAAKLKYTRLARSQICYLQFFHSLCSAVSAYKHAVTWSAFGGSLRNSVPGCVSDGSIPEMVEQCLVAAAWAQETVLKDRAELSTHVPYTQISLTSREGVYLMCRRHAADKQQVFSAQGWPCLLSGDSLGSIMWVVEEQWYGLTFALCLFWGESGKGIRDTDTFVCCSFIPVVVMQRYGIRCTKTFSMCICLQIVGSQAAA